MPRPLRFFPPNTTYEITIRTIDGLRLLRPVRALTDGINGVIGRALSRYRIDLHAHTFLSNHGHMEFTSATGDAVSSFVGHVTRNTATVIQSVTGHSGPVWEPRFTPIPILDEVAMIRRFKYVHANGVKEGLVESPLDWPGPSSARALLTGAPIEGTWMVRTPGYLREEGEPEPYRIDLVPLPCWAGLTEEARREKVRKLFDVIIEEGRWLRDGRPFLGVAKLRAQDPFEPTPIDDTPPPRAHWSDPAAFARYLAEERRFKSLHRRASAARREDAPLPFPPGGFPAAPPFETGE